MSIRVYLAGRMAVEVDGQVIIDERRFRGRQARLAFAYLVCERTRPASREELARLIWPDEAASSWEVALSALMSRLSGLLSREDISSQEVKFARGFGQYRILFPSDTWIDLEAVASAVDQAEGTLWAGRPHEVLGPATVASAIARRPFLSGADGDWVSSQRGKLERQLLRALDCLARIWLAAKEPGLAVEPAMDAVEIDPYRESSYQLLMRAHIDGGNPPKALDVYHRLRGFLAGELGTEPSSATEELYLEVLG